MDDLVLSLAPYGNASVHEFSAHDDTCLIGAGCQGLGLVPRQNNHDNGSTFSAIPYPTFAALASHDAAAPSPQSPNAGDTFPEAMTGKPQSRVQSPGHDDPDPTAHEMASVVSRHGAFGLPPQNDELVEDYPPSEAESNASCDSQCSGSKGPCSAGTCDFVTACRDENCTRPAVEPDVAHSAFILQTMTSAKEASANLVSFQDRKFYLSCSDSIHEASCVLLGTVRKVLNGPLQLPPCHSLTTSLPTTLTLLNYGLRFRRTKSVRSRYG